MTDLTFSGVFLTVEEHNCMYTVCSEGELFRVPFNHLNLNFDEFETMMWMQNSWRKYNQS